jgi:hypothetical protein
MNENIALLIASLVLAVAFTIWYLRVLWHPRRHYTFRRLNGGATVLYLLKGDRIRIIGRNIDLDVRSSHPFWMKCNEESGACVTKLQNDRLAFTMKWRFDVGMDTESNKMLNVVIMEGNDIEFTMESKTEFTVTLDS